jgi:hypothetical protein
MAAGSTIRNMFIAITVADQATAVITKLQGMTDKFKTSATQYASNVQSSFAAASAYAEQHRQVLGLIGGELVLLGTLGKNYYIQGIADAGAYSDAHTALYNRLGANTDAYLAKMKDATGGTISDTMIMTETQKALMQGLDTSKMDQIGKIALASGLSTGKDPNTAYQIIMQGIASGRMGNNSLTNIGLQMRMTEAMDRYALSVGKTAGTLTNTERKQAMMNAVLEAGDKLISNTDMNTYNYATTMAKFNNTLEDVQRVLAGSILPVVLLLAGGVSMLANAFLALPGPVQTLIGIMGAVFVILSLVGGALLVQSWLLGVLATEHVGLAEAVTMGATAYGKFLLSIFGATGAEIAGAFATGGLTAGMWALVTATAAFLIEILPVTLAVAALCVALLYLWDLSNKGWENSALYKHLLQIKQIIDNLEKNPLIHALLYLGPAAPLVVANDAYNGTRAMGKTFGSLTTGGSAGSPQINVTVNATANTQPIAPEDHAALVKQATMEGVAQGLFDGRISKMFDKRVTKDFMSGGY